ncbi:MAG: efflux transporter, family, subunit [Firmicutes bacterium]|nr:efflux transporter, family, subunit [Bacillota bacterium]
MKNGALKIGIILCSMSLFMLSGCGKQAEVSQDIPLVKTEKIAMGNLASAANYSGEVHGRYESQLAFQVSGKILARHVDLGSSVNAGDVLMEIDSKDIVQNVNITGAQVESARAQLSLAEANLNRYQKLYEESAVSAAQYDQYKTSYESALATLKQAQAQYAQGSNSLGYSKLVADQAGVISAINAEVGQVVSAGQSVVTLVKSGELEVEINIPENRLEEIKASKQIAVSFWALNNITVNGSVREIAPMADKVARTYKVRIALSNPPEQIKLGMTANVAVATGDENLLTTTTIPLTAIYQTGGVPQVWVVKDGVVSLQAITIEAFGDNRVKVISGLNNGDVIVTAGVHKLRAGQAVRLLEGEGK